jgi:hypothetical protein
VAVLLLTLAEDGVVTEGSVAGVTVEVATDGRLVPMLLVAVTVNV